MKSSQLIAIRIRLRLKYLDFKIQDFATLMGKSSSEISRWLSGKHNFTVDTLDAIQEALDMNFFINNLNPEATQPCAPCEYKPFI